MGFMRSAFAIFVAIPVAAQPVPSFAWGPDGHEFIATAARDRLAVINPQAARTFNWLVRGDVIAVSALEAKLSRVRAPELKTCHGRTLREIANWPDCIRYLKGHAGTAAHHFDEIPLCLSTAPAAPPTDRSAYRRDGKCGSDALPKYVDQLRNKNLSRSERAEALAWVIHIAGDLHQPLHAVDNEDSGGNSVAATLANDTIPATAFTTGKFHGFWDTPLVIAAVGLGAPAIDQIKAEVDSNAADPAWQSLDFIAWSRASHEIARLAYNKLPQVPACGAGTANGGTIGASYVSFFDDKVKAQLSAAALRLSIILGDALSSSTE